MSGAVTIGRLLQLTKDSRHVRVLWVLWKLGENIIPDQSSAYSVWNWNDMSMTFGIAELSLSVDADCLTTWINVAYNMPAPHILTMCSLQPSSAKCTFILQNHSKYFIWFVSTSSFVVSKLDQRIKYMCHIVSVFLCFQMNYACLSDPIWSSARWVIYGDHLHSDITGPLSIDFLG